MARTKIRGSARPRSTVSTCGECAVQCGDAQRQKEEPFAAAADHQEEDLIANVAVIDHQELEPAIDVDATIQQEVEPPLAVDAHVQQDEHKVGPEDMSVLRSFLSHIASRILIGEDRDVLKTVNHGKKFKRTALVEQPQYLQDVVERAGLDSLAICSYCITDTSLVSAFVERWHQDTNTFHLPIGEMTITLDDVSAILHLPVTGQFILDPEMSIDIANSMLVGLLGVSYNEAILETMTTRGSYVRFSWLQDIYQRLKDENRRDCAIRAYLLYLVGCTLFTDKSATYTHVKYLELFRDLDRVDQYAWGAAGLAFLYEHLKDASLYWTRQCGGYLTLLQAWIFEHFPTIVSPPVWNGYGEHMPRARRWLPQRGTHSLLDFRIALDQLRMRDVCWTPYTRVREHHSNQEVAFYSGYLRCGVIRQAHLPERVLRQLGHIQSIPRSPRFIMDREMTMQDIDKEWQQFDLHVLDDVLRGPVATTPNSCVDGYMHWFWRISCCTLLPMSRRQSDSTNERVPDTTFDRVRQRDPSPDSAKTRMRKAAELLSCVLEMDLREKANDAQTLIRRAYLTLVDDSLPCQLKKKKNEESSIAPQ